MAGSQAVVRALGGKLNLGALVAATGGAAILESWFVLFVGVAAFVGLVVRDVRAGQRKLYRSFPRMPQGATFSNPAIRSTIEGIGAAQRERAEVIGACSEEVLRMLDDILRAAVEAEAAALRLAKRTDRLHGYLSTKDMASVKETLYAAQQSARLAKTPQEREIYEAAARTYEIEVETIGGIELGVRVALAKLENLRAALAVVPPRIMKLSATNADLADLTFSQMFDELRLASDELDEAEARFLTLARGAENQAKSEYMKSAAMSSAVRIAVRSESAEELSELDGLAQSELVSSRRTVALDVMLGR